MDLPAMTAISTISGNTFFRLRGTRRNLVEEAPNILRTAQDIQRKIVQGVLRTRSHTNQS